MMLLVGSGLTNSTHDGGHHPLTAGENEHLSTSGSVYTASETKQAIPSILLFIVLILNTGNEDTLIHKGAAVLHKEFNYVLCNFLINLLMSLKHPQTLHNGNVLGQLHSLYQ